MAGTKASPKTTTYNKIRSVEQILKDKKITKQSKMPENIKKHINKKLLYFAINNKVNDIMKILEEGFDEEKYQPPENYGGDESKFESELDVNYQDEKNSMTALMHACINGNSNLIYGLIDNDADVNMSDDEGITALMYAAMNGHDTTPLIDNDADMSEIDKTGMTALMYAAMNGHLHVVNQLMEKSDFDKDYINMKNQYGKTASDLSSENIQEYIKSKLDELDESDSERSERSTSSKDSKRSTSRKTDSDRPAPQPNKAMLNDSILKHVEKMELTQKDEMYIKEGTYDIDYANKGMGMTALMYACRSGNKDLTNLLLKAGANVNISDKTGTTALMHAIRNWNREEAKLLIKANADVNMSNKKKETALLYAANFWQEDVIDALIKADADVNASADDDGMTPLMYIVRDGHSYEILNRNKTVDFLKQDKKGMTALMYAVMNGSKDLVYELLKESNTIDDDKYINLKNKEGQTAYDLANLYGGYSYGGFSESIEKIKKLIKSSLEENEKLRKNTEKKKNNKSKDPPVTVTVAEDTEDETYYEFSENKYKLICEEMMEKLEKISGDILIETDIVNLNLYTDFVFNPQANRPNSMLHADMVNVYYRLLQKKFPENLYLVTSVLYSYDDINTIGNKVTDLIIIEEDGERDFQRLKKFLSEKNNKPIEKMLDRMLDMIDAGKHKLFFPIFLNQNHFALCEIDIATKSFVYHDSLLQKKKDENGFTANATKYIKLVRDLIIDYYEYKKKQYASRNALKNWVLTKPIDAEQRDEAPQQNNDYDCGVYTCAFGYLLSANENIPDKFTKTHMQNIRLRIKQSFVNGIITP